MVGRVERRAIQPSHQYGHCALDPGAVADLVADATLRAVCDTGSRCERRLFGGASAHTGGLESARSRPYLLEDDPGTALRQSAVVCSLL